MPKNNDQNLSVVILAAGKGTRMKSSQAKVLHEVFFKPMLHHVLGAIEPLKPKRSVVVVGHQEARVCASLQGFNVEIVRQEEQLGTGHAVQMARSVIPEDDGLVLILCGDTPLITTASLENMLVRHLSEGADLTLMTTILENPFGYGRIISTEDSITAIVEEKEANADQKQIKEVNAGIYLVERDFLFKALTTITPENTQGEFYLTDIVEYAVNCGKKVQKCVNSTPLEVLGVNSRVELEAAHRLLQKQQNIKLMQQGISIANSDTVAVASTVEFSGDSYLDQNVQISGSTRIGLSCSIGSGVVLRDCKVGDNVKIGANCVLVGCRVADGAELAPLTYGDKTTF